MNLMKRCRFRVRLVWLDHKPLILHLFQYITAGLVRHKPEDPIGFIKHCLAYMKNNPKEKVEFLIIYIDHITV